MKFLILLLSLNSIAADFPPGVPIKKAGFCRMALLNRDDSLNLRPLANVTVLNEGTPPHPHELRAANRFAKILQHRNQKVLLITAVMDRSIPGLDGVILDSKNLPLANIALKSSSSGTKLKRLIDSTIDQVVYYSVPSNWADSTNLFRETEATPKSASQAAKFQSAYDWMTRAFGIFGVGLNRPTYIFIDYNGNVTQALSISDAEMVQRRMNQKRFYKERTPIVEEVVIQGLDGIYNIKLP